MNKKDFIVINLNQNISKARKAAIKKEKNKWVIFTLICTIYIALICWRISMDMSATELISGREDKINYIIKETEKLTNDDLMELSEDDINGAYKLGKKWIPWSTKLIQLSEITPHNMCITKLDFSRGELKISAISRIENNDQKDMAICNQFIESLKNHNDFYREFEKIEFSKSKRVETSKEPYLSFEIIANIKKRQKNRIDDMEIQKNEIATPIVKNIKKESANKGVIKQQEKIVEKKSSSSKTIEQKTKKSSKENIKKEVNIKGKNAAKKNGIKSTNDSANQESSIFDWPILNYFFGSIETIENEKKMIENKTSNKTKEKKKEKYSIEIIGLAKSIEKNPTTESVSKFQELLRIYNKSDKMYGELDAKTIVAISEVLNKKSKSEWEKKFNEKNKVLSGDGIEKKKSQIKYSKHAIKLANQIATQNPDNPDPILIKEFQEATGIASEGDPGYGKFNPKTIQIWAKILGVEE